MLDTQIKSRNMIITKLQIHMALAIIILDPKFRNPYRSDEA